MKKAFSIFIISGVLSAFIVPSLNAQKTADTCKFMSGGFGHFFFGPAFLQTPAITDYLKKSDVLGADYSPSKVSYSIGGEGGGMSERFFIGGGGFGIVSPAASTDLGTANVTVGGGYFKFGYKFYEKPKAFMFAYASFGGSGYSIELSNLSDSAYINFNHKSPLAPSEKKTYSVSGFLLDFGASLKTIPMGKMSETKRGIGGFMLGLDAGVVFALPLSEWNTDNNVVVGPPDLSGMVSPYIRLTIGGGGFGYEKK